MAVLLATTSPESRQASKAHEYSVNWIEGGGQTEVVNGSTGRTVTDATSRISKRSLLAKFVRLSSTEGLVARNSLMEVVAGRDREPGALGGVVRSLRYDQLKRLASAYREAKDGLVKGLERSGAGAWVKKPVEQVRVLRWRDFQEEN